MVRTRIGTPTALAFLALSLLAVGPAASPARAQPGAAPGAALQSIAPFVNANTIFVAHLDVGRLNLQGGDAWVNDMVKAIESDPQKQAEAAKEATEGFKKAQDWVASMKKAGASSVYVVSGMPQEQGAPPPAAVIVPVAAGGNAADVQKLITPPDAADQGMTTAVVRNAVVLAQQAQIEQYQKAPPAGGGEGANLAQMGKALASVGNSPLQVAIVPNAQLKQMLQMLAGMLGGAGGGQPGQPGQPQQNNLGQTINAAQWVAFGVNSPPQPSLTFVVQATDAQAAQRMADDANKAIAQAKQDPQLNAGGRGDRVAKMFAPQVKGDQVSVTLTTEQLNQLIRQDLAPMIREQAGGAGRAAPAPSPNDR